MRSPHPPIFPPTTRPPPSDTHPSHTFKKKQKTNKPPWSCLVSPSSPPPTLPSPQTSRFSILFPSTTFLRKSSGLAARGEENGGSGEAAGPVGGRCFGTGRARPPGSSSGTTHQFGSVSSHLNSPVLLGGGSWTWPRLWWPRALSQYSLSTHNSYQPKRKNI